MIGRHPEPTLPGPATTDRYGVLTLDELSLLIPQQQIHALEPGFDVQRAEGDGGAWIAVAGDLYPVYCLSEDLRPVPETRGGRRICVLLDTGSRLFGLLCDQVAMLDRARTETVPLPECMRTPDTPLQELALHGERVFCVTSAPELLACVGEHPLPLHDSALAQMTATRAP